MKRINSFESDLIDSEILNELQELQKEFDATKGKYGQTLEEMRNLSVKFSEEVEQKNPYKAAMDAAKAAEEVQTADIGTYRNAHEQRLATDRWYSQEFSKVLRNTKKLSPDESVQELFDLEALYSDKKAKSNEALMMQHAQKLGNVFSGGLQDMLVNYKSFDDTMKGMTKQLYSYLIQEAMNWAIRQISLMGWFKKLGGASGGGGGAASSGGGFIDNIFGLFKGGGGTKGVSSGFLPPTTLKDKLKQFFGIMKYHDGGVVPVGANTAIPGTKEQLAILKGGERILSPGENSGYSSSQGMSSPVVFNNFNIKAWDSKDVRKYLLENRELLNSITFEGIKNNNGHLRTMVRNA